MNEQAERQFQDQETFFAHVGHHVLFPKFYGETYWAVTVEEFYQHFKARLIVELAARDHVTPDCFRELPLAEMNK